MQVWCCAGSVRWLVCRCGIVSVRWLVCGVLPHRDDCAQKKTEKARESGEHLVGHEVTLNGLVSAPQLNGVRGTVVSAKDPATGRHTIQLATTGNAISVKPENFTLLTADPVTGMVPACVPELDGEGGQMVGGLPSRRCASRSYPLADHDSRRSRQLLLQRRM